ncbi:MAG: hypothetical protein R6V85_01230 [Polyangia bacterium]
MSNSNVKIENRHAGAVVRLMVDGAGSAVNAIRDQHTNRGVSLICPFPALEVQIPVEFGAGEGSRKGTIHRIGVEDDPETGLPRLRLSVRAHDTRATVVSPPPESLLDESSRVTRLPKEAERAATDLDLDFDSHSSVAVPDEAKKSSRDDEEEIPSLFADLVTPAEEDPAWAACGELEIPDEIDSRPRTRRRRYAGVVAWTMVLSLVAGGAFALHRAGAVDLGDLKKRAVALLSPERGSVEGDQLDAVAEAADPAVEAGSILDGASVSSEQEDFSSGGSLLPASSISDPSLEPVAAPSELAVEEEGAEEEAAKSGKAAKEEVREVAAADTGGSRQSAESSEEKGEKREAMMVLPTRWPAEYASAYRLRDPNGVVVDVPGGLVRDEGWISVEGDEHPMVDSVKAIQRETGARFVVFIKGELPRFMTAPKTGGVLLKLYHEGEKDETAPAEQVAMLEEEQQ